MNKLTKVISGVWVFCFFSLPAISQNVAVIDTQAAILQTQVAQDAFKALEEETEYSSMIDISLDYRQPNKGWLSPQYQKSEGSVQYHFDLIQAHEHHKQLLI